MKINSSSYSAISAVILAAFLVKMKSLQLVKAPDIAAYDLQGKK